MPSETYTLSPALLTPELQPLVPVWNEIFRRLSTRLDALDGTQGTPSIRNVPNFNGHRLGGVGDPVNSDDAVSLRYADDRYVRRSAGMLDSVVIGGIPGFALDAGKATVTGSLAIITRLGQVTYAVASIGADPALTLYPGVEIVVAGRGFTIKLWQPTSNTDPTPIPSTATGVAVYWLAVGVDLSGGAAVSGASSSSQPSGAGATSGGSGSGGGGSTGGNRGNLE